mgnify:CR=1 FL=1
MSINELGLNYLYLADSNNLIFRVSFITLVSVSLY